MRQLPKRRYVLKPSHLMPLKMPTASSQGSKEIFLSLDICRFLVVFLSCSCSFFRCFSTVVLSGLCVGFRVIILNALGKWGFGGFLPQDAFVVKIGRIVCVRTT